jgi:hypothetical protein
MAVNDELGRKLLLPVLRCYISLEGLRKTTKTDYLAPGPKIEARTYKKNRSVNHCNVWFFNKILF